MSSKLATVRKALRDAIKPHVPAKWRIVPSLEAIQKLAVPALYFEFTRIANTVDGQPIPAGTVLTEFDLVVTVPLGSVAKDEDAVDAAVLDLILALDGLDDVMWDTAEKGRLGDQLAWRVSISHPTSLEN
ncbi:hypothetical protein ACWGR3_30925 [Streptomyces albidoflavus]